MKSLSLAVLALLCLDGVLATLSAQAIVVRNRNNSWGENPDDAVKQAMSFGDLDGDLDGKISQKEWSEARKQMDRALKETRAAALSGLDTDQTGKLTEYEAQAAKGRWISLWDRAIEMAITSHDKDGDGKLNDAEAEPVVKRLQALVQRHNLRIPKEKTQASRDEVAAAFQEVIDGKRTIFSMCDVNNDGKLSQQEIDYALEIIAAIAGM